MILKNINLFLIASLMASKAYTNNLRTIELETKRQAKGISSKRGQIQIDDELDKELKKAFNATSALSRTAQQKEVIQQKKHAETLKGPQKEYYNQKRQKSKLKRKVLAN